MIIFVDVLGSLNSSCRDRSATSSLTSLDSIFDGLADSTTKTTLAVPVYDKSIYDDNISDGASGLKHSSLAIYEDIFFFAILSGSGHVSTPSFVDLLQKLSETNARVQGQE
ncbi:hypothetical protein ZIOFF_045757 [Zingiber officinale]|uniref:Uncharacterized protein n=1 Tax=Zingiber officinale TaxID=94328 RepID=A0A8J5G1J1_ZINOF|nr:hypothetical protein ZIOFF_045757 [Zingiber officinale]